MLIKFEGLHGLGKTTLINQIKEKTYKEVIILSNFFRNTLKTLENIHYNVDRNTLQAAAMDKFLEFESFLLNLVRVNSNVFIITDRNIMDLFTYIYYYNLERELEKLLIYAAHRLNDLYQNQLDNNVNKNHIIIHLNYGLPEDKNELEEVKKAIKFYAAKGDYDKIYSEDVGRLKTLGVNLEIGKKYKNINKIVDTIVNDISNFENSHKKALAFLQKEAPDYYNFYANHTYYVPLTSFLKVYENESLFSLYEVRNEHILNNHLSFLMNSQKAL